MSDLFKFFGKANNGDMRYVDKMTDEEVKGIAPFVLLGWGMGAETNEGIHAIMTNEYMNDKVFSLGKNPRLLLKLFVAANCDIDNTKYRYIKSKTANKTKEAEAIARYYQCGLREAKDYAKILGEDDIKLIVDMMGEQ